MAKIITVPNPVLRKKSKAVTKVNRSVVDLIKALKKTLDKAEEPKGVGLSAVQIGKPVRIFLARQDPDSEAQVFINPKITWKSKEMTDGVTPPDGDRKPKTEDSKEDREQKSASGGEKKRPEGCLSVPGYYGVVKRHKKIKLKYYTLYPRRYTLKEKTKLFSGFLATVIQHELDHLNGILFIDRVLEQGGKLYKIEEDKLVETSL